jgi:hypothetical protein
MMRIAVLIVLFVASVACLATTDLRCKPSDKALFIGGVLWGGCQ